MPKTKDSRHRLYTIRENNSKMDYRLSVKCKPLKPPEDNNRKVQVILGRVMPFQIKHPTHNP